MPVKNFDIFQKLTLCLAVILSITTITNTWLKLFQSSTETRLVSTFNDNIHNQRIQNNNSPPTADSVYINFINSETVFFLCCVKPL